MNFRRLRLSSACCLVAAAALALAPGAAMGAKGGKSKDDGDTDGPLSQASLDAATCGCPTTFEPDPACSDRLAWGLAKDDRGGFDDPRGESFVFDVTVTEEGPRRFLQGSGEVVLTNSGGLSAVIHSLALNLEEANDRTCPDEDLAPGPSGKNWCTLGTAIAVAADGSDGSTNHCLDYAPEEGPPGAVARTCYGDLWESRGTALRLRDCDTGDEILLSGADPVAATTDTDGDGLRDEDPVCSTDDDGDGLIDEDPVNGINDDGDRSKGQDLIDEDDADDDLDGSLDEDGPCQEAVRICFDYEFDITGLDISTDGPDQDDSDDLRLNMMITFGSAGSRGGSGASCALDVDCDYHEDPDDQSTELVDEWEGDWQSGRGRNANIRTVQERYQFDADACPDQAGCDSVALDDPGSGIDPDSPRDCVEVVLGEGDILFELIEGSGMAETTYPFLSGGTVSCLCTYVGQIQAGLDQEAGDDGQATLKVHYPGNRNAPSYFDHYLTGAGSLDEVWHDGWCIDTDGVIYNDRNYTVEMVSSYDPARYAGLVEYPENLDAVNWLVNQDFIGEPISGCEGPVTYGDVQRTIWELVEDNPDAGSGASYNACRVSALKDEATRNGDGFEPDCDQVTAVIMKPLSGHPNGDSRAVQVTIAQIAMGSIPGVCPAACACTATITNEATLACTETGSGDLIDTISGSPAAAAFDVQCGYEEPSE